MAAPVEIFCCYAREDQLFLQQLKTHLMPLQWQRLITLWADTDINAGWEWEKEIEKHLETAHMILLLISPDFMASEYCYSKEMKRAVERHERGEARVIPVILRPCLWQQAPFGKLQALPRDTMPVTSVKWHNLDDAFFNVAEGIHKAVEELTSKHSAESLISPTQEEPVKPLITIKPEEFVWLRTLIGHAKAIYGLAVSPDGKTLASGSNDKTIKLWSLISGELLGTLTGHLDWVSSVTFTSDGQTLVSGSYDNKINIWDWQSRKRLNTLTGHLHHVQKIAFIPNMSTLASSSDDGTIKVWGMQSGKALFDLTDHSGPYYGLAVNPAGEILACGGDMTIKLWHLPRRELLHNLTGHADRIVSLAITPDGKTLVSGSHDHTIKVWSLDSGKLLHNLTEHARKVISVAISPDGQTLVSGSYDQTMMIWNLQSGKLLQTIRGHTRYVDAVAISPDGQTFVSGSHDNTIKVWRKKGNDIVIVLGRMK